MPCFPRVYWHVLFTHLCVTTCGLDNWNARRGLGGIKSASPFLLGVGRSDSQVTTVKYKANWCNLFNPLGLRYLFRVLGCLHSVAYEVAHAFSTSVCLLLPVNSQYSLRCTGGVIFRAMHWPLVSDKYKSHEFVLIIDLSSLILYKKIPVSFANWYG